MKFIKTTVKKRFTKFVMPVAAVLMAFALLPVAALAATGAQNGLEVSLTTDKSSYEAGETVAVNLAVTKTNSFAVNNVKLEVTLPAGFKLQTGSATLTIASLAAEAAETYSLTALTEAASTSQPGSLQTGDESNILLWIVLLVLSAGGIVTGLYLFKKRHKGAKFLSLYLCFALLTVLAAPVLPARAATVLKGFSVSEGITVDGEGKTIAAQVTYDWSAPPTIASANNTTVTGETGSTFQVTVTSTAPIGYSLSGEPTGVSVDDTGLITITNATIDGTHIFTITARNGTAPDVTQTFTLYVLDPAHAYAVGDAYP